jgi:hypothetical protein
MLAAAMAPECPALTAIHPARRSRRGYRRALSRTQSSGRRLKTTGRTRYIPSMLRRKELEIPPEVAKAFVRYMKAFFKSSGQEADEIAAKQAWAAKAAPAARGQAAGH